MNQMRLNNLVRLSYTYKLYLVHNSQHVILCLELKLFTVYHDLRVRSSQFLSLQFSFCAFVSTYVLQELENYYFVLTWFLNFTVIYCYSTKVFLTFGPFCQGYFAICTLSYSFFPNESVMLFLNDFFHLLLHRPFHFFVTILTCKILFLDGDPSVVTLL